MQLHDVGIDVDAGAARRAGRVVMLVDNAVEHDSRVQKAAHSAAERGWDVVLLGRAAGEPRTWRIGDAEVRLLQLSTSLDKRRHEFRRHWIMAPLAYPPTGIASRRQQEIDAWRADLAVRQLKRHDRTATGVSPAAIRTDSALRLRAEVFASRVVGKWVGFRRWQLAFGQRARGRLVLPNDRLYTWFWSAVMRERAWRRLEPGLWDYELAYGPVIDELAPDIIHANDFRMLGVGARALVRARAEGRDVKLVWDAHEFLPGVEPWRNNTRWLPGNVAHEREYAPYADAVITVSESLAELLQKRHHLDRRPDVVLNAPSIADMDGADDADGPDIRALCGIDRDVPLVVYSGVTAAKRGLDVMIEAMPRMPAAHVAIIAGNVTAPYLVGLTKRAATLGVADRLHVLSYVPHHRVVSFLSGADVGIIPIRHYPNHEIALITKFFEYSHARLPIVVSDVRTMAETVATTGQGEVFRVDDVADYVRAVETVLKDPARYRAAYDAPGLLAGWTWEAQADKLDRVYRELLVSAPADAAAIGQQADSAEMPAHLRSAT